MKAIDFRNFWMIVTFASFALIVVLDVAFHVGFSDG